ncbi:MAG: tetratricopeptide repeat protein [Solirubrobacteraceae bacterium]
MVGATVTMLFSDMEGSTLMLQRLGECYADLIREHHHVMRLAIESAGGRVVRIAGDSFFAIFGRAAEAVSCAQRAQCDLAAREWPGGEAPRVRMGIHSGTPTISEGEFVGVDVHRAARVMSVAYGGQVLLTEETVRLLGSAVRVRDLGYHRLKDLSAPEHLFQLSAAGLAADFPPLRSLNRSNLPTPANRLVGRVEELARAAELLSRQDVRLLTLLGPGGVGKTRVSIELAGDAVLRYRDGVWIVALAPIRDEALMVSEIARVLEVAPLAGEPLRQTLSARLAERELLLVLDNFEHLLDAAGVVAELLAAAPKVDVLCTSREPLRIRGEQRLEVGPLPVRDASDLFLQRALAARPELSVDEEDHAAIARICGRLDGLPLALEMAASRTAIFAPRALEVRLAEGLALAEGPRDLPERQRTLHATIDWSYQLLDPDEQALFRSLAPFVGGVRVDSAASLWGSPSVQGLISLAEKSLLGRREDPDGEPRFWMLETVREFALSRATAEGLTESMAAAHAEHYCELTERAAPEHLGKNQRRWVDTLEQENPNLRAALDRLTAQDPSRALRMAANLEWFWVVRGYVFEGRGRLVEALGSAPPNAPHRGRALAAAGQLTLDLGEAAEAEPLLLEALELARRDGDARLASHVLSHLGWAAEALGDPARARAYHVEAVAAAREAQDASALELALNNYAVMIARLGDVPAARPLLEESLRLARSRGEPSVISLTAGNLAIMALDAGELETAEALVRESLARAREVDFRGMVSSALTMQAVILLARGNLDQACAELAEAIEAVRAIRHIETVASTLSVAGTIAAMRHQPIQAATLWAAADRHRERVHLAEDPNVERFRAKWQLRARAEARDTNGWTAAQAAGAELSLDGALDLATDATKFKERNSPAERATIAN